MYTLSTPPYPLPSLPPTAQCATPPSPPPFPFFSHHPATTVLHPLSLHDALPISGSVSRSSTESKSARTTPSMDRPTSDDPWMVRSEEHTSELQSRFDLVCRLLLEKKNQKLLSHETFRRQARSSDCTV